VELLLTIVMLAGVVALVGGPLRRHSRPPTLERPEVAAAAAAKDAKYRELLDAELDFRTGKLAEEDYREIDDALRREAVELMHRHEAERDLG
jgi:hypothetical protein